MSMTRLDDRTNHFRDINAWPRQQDLNAELWLENFRHDEQDIAKRLLSNFCYFNKLSTDALLRQAIQNHLSKLWGNPNIPEPPSKIDLGTTNFVICEGESPHATDSGNYFARRLRDGLNIPEHIIKSPHEALQNVSTIFHYIFIDDFVGSGNQFIETIKRVHMIQGQPRSFADLVHDPAYLLAYCPCLATSYACENKVKKDFPNIHLHPAHLLGGQHCATQPSSRIWNGLSPDDANNQIERLRHISIRAGYDRQDGGQNDWRGFHKLGLSIAFEHGIPDACLPIYFSSRNNWKPLMRRS